MGIVKVYECDLCQQASPRAMMRVVLVGRLDQRTEDYGRVLVGPECHTGGLGDAIKTGEADMFTEEPPADVALALAQGQV